MLIKQDAQRIKCIYVWTEVHIFKIRKDYYISVNKEYLGLGLSLDKTGLNFKTDHKNKLIVMIFFSG